MDSLTKQDLLENLRQVNFKILFVGDYGVGKTSIIRSYIDGKFSSNYKVTIGVDFALKTIVWKNNEKLNLQFWDVAGNERSYKFLTSAYYRYASAAIIVVDSIVPNYIASIEQWSTGLRHNLDLSIPIVIFVNKCDLPVSRIDKQILDQVCYEHNLIGWFSVSAKTRENIEESINFVISQILCSKSQQECSKITEVNRNMSIFTQVDSYTITTNEQIQQKINLPKNEDKIILLKEKKTKTKNTGDEMTKCC
jgi:Ras-related protein Rab-32